MKITRVFFIRQLVCPLRHMRLRATCLFAAAIQRSKYFGLALIGAAVTSAKFQAKTRHIK